jgi:hypothetical protein
MDISCAGVYDTCSCARVIAGARIIVGRGELSGADMSPIAPRIAPVPPAEWTAEMRDFFAIMEGPEARENGSKFNVVRTLAHHPQLASSFMNYYKLLATSSTLSLRGDQARR